MKTAIIGYPRIGKNRELKFRIEDYFKKNITPDALEYGAKELRYAHWNCIARKGIDFIPSNDFSFYDNMLDTAYLFNIIPQRYKDLKLCDLNTYFAMTRGYQAKDSDAKALPMKKWFNTNYHYIVPEFENSTEVKLLGEKPFTEFKEALEADVKTTPVIIGPFTLLKLSNFSGSKNAGDFADSVIDAYGELLKRFSALNAEWVQFDEPSLVTDLTSNDKALFFELYSGLLKSKGNIKILLVL